MPPQNGFDPSQAAQDKDFLAASPADKIKYLSAMDSDFAKASPAEQRGYIAHLVEGMQPITEPEREGGLHAYASDLWNFVKGAPAMFQTPGINPGTGQLTTGAAGAAQQNIAAIAQADAARKARGEGVPYRMAATAAQAVGTNVPAMEEAASKGDIGGVLGHAAAPATVALAPYGAKLANRIIPSTTRAGAGLSALTDSPDAQFAQHPVETPKALATARKLEAEANITGEKPPQQVQHYLSTENLRNVPPEIADTLKTQGIDPSQPLTMYEARTMLKRVNEAIYDRNLAQPTRNALKRFAGALDEDISDAAQQGGFGKDYEAMRTEYRRGSKIIRAGENVGPVAGGAIGGYLGSKAGGLAAAEGTGLGALAGRYIGKPTIGAVTRAVIERNAGPPHLSSLPPTREAYTRTLLDAKEGLISPQEANRRIQRAGGSIRTRPIPRPTD